LALKPLTLGQQTKLRSYRQQGFKAATAAEKAGVTLMQAQAFYAKPLPPTTRVLKPKVIVDSRRIKDQPVDHSDAYFARVRWAAKDALAETLAKKRAAIAAQT